MLFYSCYSFQIVLAFLFCFCFNIDPKSSFKQQRDLYPAGCCHAVVTFVAGSLLDDKIQAIAYCSRQPFATVFVREL